MISNRTSLSIRIRYVQKVKIIYFEYFYVPLHRHKLVHMYRGVRDKGGFCKHPEKREVWSLLKHLARQYIRQLDTNDMPKSRDCNTENIDSGLANGI